VYKRQLERYLVMVNDSNIQPLVLLSKSDLVDTPEMEEKVNEIRALMPDVTVVAFSNETGTGIEEVKQLLISGKTFCFLGSSGVGKTTLLNKLLYEAQYETQTVREKDGRGRHTTTRRELVILENGVMEIDMPGMRELGNFDVDSGIDETFNEITELSRSCRYNNCTHIKEDGCAVLAALKAGEISEERYGNYIKMMKESAYYEMSYLEKRQKDREFGKMCRSVMKDKKKRE